MAFIPVFRYGLSDTTSCAASSSDSLVGEHNLSAVTYVLLLRMIKCFDVEEMIVIARRGKSFKNIVIILVLLSYLWNGNLSYTSDPT